MNKSDIEIFIKEDGTAEVVEHYPDGELDYGANAASWSLTVEQMTAIRDILSDAFTNSTDLTEFVSKR